MLIPFPTPPAIRKVPDQIFSHIAAAIDLPEVIVDLRNRFSPDEEASEESGQSDGDTASNSTRVSWFKNEMAERLLIQGTTALVSVNAPARCTHRPKVAASTRPQSVRFQNVGALFR